MRRFQALRLMNLRLYLREPAATFFLLVFPPFMVLLLFGNQPNELIGGFGAMDISMLVYTAMILGSVGWITVPITLSGYRESGLLRRLRATPLRPLTNMLSDACANLVLTLLGILILVVLGWLIYRVRFEDQVWSVFLAIIFSGLAMFAAGYLIAGVVPVARAAQAMGMILYYPRMFLSRATVPLEVMPEGVRRVADFLPLTHVVRLLCGLWLGNLERTSQ